MITFYVVPVTDALRADRCVPAGATLAVVQHDHGQVDVLCTDLDATRDNTTCPDIARAMTAAARAWAGATGAVYGGWLPADPVPAATSRSGRDGHQDGEAA